MEQLKVASAPLVLPLLIISTGKHIKWEEVVRRENKDEAIDSYTKSGVNTKGKVDKNHGAWMLPTFVFTVAKYEMRKV